MSYTHRERVLATLNHQQPDRVPVDLMGNATMLLDNTYLQLRDFLGLSPIPPVRAGTSANYYDERVLDKLDIDFRRLFLKRGVNNQIRYYEDGSFTDAWGIRFKEAGIFVNALEHPLKHAQTIADIDAFPWPTADDLFSAEGLADKARAMYSETDFALVARNPMAPGFLDRGCFLMGMAEFMMLMGTDPAVADRLIEHVLEIYLGVYTNFLDAVGPWVQMVEVADDLGGQQNLLISPAMYRRFIKPAEKELYGRIHELAPNAFLFHHTDGNVFKILPDLIEVGVDVLNPVQTSAREMHADRLKEMFGHQLTFHGAVEKMEGDRKTLVAEVRNHIDVMGVNGGYVMASCNHMIDVPPENILAMFETAQSHTPAQMAK
jgi:uroporphyrinogen decarboxylase